MSNRRIINLPDNQIQSWDSFIYEEKEYCFRYLDAHKITYTKKDLSEKYDFFITISHHVFTVSIPENHQTDSHLLYTDKPEDPRHFCLVRYNLSLKICDILKTLPEQFCYHGGYTKYCCCMLKDEDGNEINYQIVFKVWKEKKKLRLHVESAYPLKEKLKKPKKVGFWVVCYNLLKGKKLPTP